MTRPYILRKGVSSRRDLIDPFERIHGDVFYVNGYGTNGSDTNAGDTPDEAWLTLTHAISNCQDDHDDYIFVINYYQATGETWPISIDKNGIHIIGFARPGPLPYSAIHPSTDVAAFSLTSNGQYGEIAGFTIGGGSAHGGIEWGAGGQSDGMWIHHCTFGHQWFGTPLHGIYQPSTASRGGYGNLIEDCLFMGDLANCTGAITSNGISMESVTQTHFDLTVRNCTFMGVAVGISAGKVSNGVFVNNKFIVADSGDGEAIALLTGCRGCLVDGNRAMNGGDAAMTQQPYVDVAATNKNHWGVNYTTDAVDLPKQTA